MSNNMTIEYIRDHKDEINWNYMSLFKQLSEDFIREFKDYVDWNSISSEQHLSEDFHKRIPR